MEKAGYSEKVIVGGRVMQVREKKETVMNLIHWPYMDCEAGLPWWNGHAQFSCHFKFVAQSCLQLLFSFVVMDRRHYYIVGFPLKSCMGNRGPVLCHVLSNID